MDLWLYRNPRALAVVILVVLAMGWSAWTTFGRQEDPTITNIFATILTPYPGADPARVEALVTEKIEAELRFIPAIAEIGSASRSGLSVVSIDLAETLPKDAIELAWTDVRNALDDVRASLPAGAGTPEFRNEATDAFTVISALQPRDGEPADPVLLTRMAEDLRDRLRALPGTKRVEIYGAVEEEILVEIDPAPLASLGIAAAEVASRIEAADAKVPAGRVHGAERDLVVEVEGAIGDLARIRSIPLRTGAEGGLVRVGDVAAVSRTPLDPPASIGRLDGRPAVLVAARMEPDLQVNRWAARARAALAEFEAELPGAVTHRLVFDQSTYTDARFAELGWNIALGVGLVGLVLLLTLGWRAAVVVAATLPLAGLLSLFALRLWGISLHQMSVTGMIVALGLLVDAAIVMSDGIRRRLAAGEGREAAIAASIRSLAVPLGASTLTTVLAFAPMAMLPGPVGDFVGSIAKSVIVMLVASFLLALTVTPALAGRLLPAGASGPWWEVGMRVPRLGRAFERSIELSLAHPWLSMLAALALPTTGFLAFPTLTAQFFPGADRNQFHVQLTLGDGASIRLTEAVSARADAVLRATDGVTDVAWVVGENAPAFYYNMVADQDGNAAFAEALVTTRSAAATQGIIQEVQAALDRALPEAQAVARELVQGPPVAAPVELRFVGRDLAALREVGDRARAIMAEVPGVILARATLAGGAPKLLLELDDDRVALTGLDLAGVADRLALGLDGVTGGSLVEGPVESPVRVRLASEERASPDAVLGFDVLLPNAPSLAASGLYPAVPLTALGALAVVPSESPIQRRNGERINLVQGFVAPGILPEEALADLRARLDAMPGLLPLGVRLELGGDADARADTVDNLLATVLLVVVLSLATLVLSFGSFRLAGVAVLVCLLAAGLSVLALAVFRYPFGIQALIGVIGSIGVSINAAIVLLSALLEDPAARRRDRAAMRGVVTGASRHIVSTTVTTFGGFLPLILAGGGFWPPFAMAVAGGVLLSTVVSFYLTPPLFALVWRERDPAATAEAAP